jgi:hypothetical protein
VHEAIDCAVLDHLVFTGIECTSIRKMRLLWFRNRRVPSEELFGKRRRRRL